MEVTVEDLMRLIGRLYVDNAVLRQELEAVRQALRQERKPGPQQADEPLDQP